MGMGNREIETCSKVLFRSIIMNTSSGIDRGTRWRMVKGEGGAEAAISKCINVKQACIIN